MNILRFGVSLDLLNNGKGKILFTPCEPNLFRRTNVSVRHRVDLQFGSAHRVSGTRVVRHRAGDLHY